MKTRIAIIAAFLLVPMAASACIFDTDCVPGSRCVKSSGTLYGVCAGGLFPGNRNDSEPVFAPLDPNRTVGNTCSFDTECGPGNRCFKSSGAIEGVCVKAR